MKNIAIFASGAGTNALNLIKASQDISNVNVRALIVDTLTSPLPETVNRAFPEIPVYIVLQDQALPKEQRRQEHEERILEVLISQEVEWILLAGHMKIIGPTLLNRFSHRIFNIHPSLLPAYPGKDAYQRAFNDKISSGVTVHLVDAGMDTGPVIVQKELPLLPSDTLESFVQRGKEIEWEVYPVVLRMISEGRIFCRSGIMERIMFTIFSKEQDQHQVFWVDHEGSPIDKKCTASFKKRIIDSIDQELFLDLSEEFFKAMEGLRAMELIYFRPGVTDNPAKSFQELIARDELFQGRELRVHSGIVSTNKLDFNPLIQCKVSISQEEDLKEMARIDFSTHLIQGALLGYWPILSMSDDQMFDLSRKNCWALSLAEMKAIKAHFDRPEVQSARVVLGLSHDPTDVEMEMLAQTWSEHCKHKIFAADIDYEDEEQKITIKGLFKEFIKRPTYEMNKPWAVSLFDDNAGVVRFREGMDICVKVETHNSPSALDPYGGALTGILGVNRDILGTGLGARPVANTNVFCVGMPDENEMPADLLHPKEILKGIHRGIMDGGNKSGIPTINGAIHFDESYSGKPLVYCGTVGILPPLIQDRDACHKGHRPGDYIVMVGGAVGIDGIHGATASSLVMDKHTTLGMVQIGDPFTQKRVTDFVLAARDRLLYNSITDNGAGGLSSSVGEMAMATNGATLNLEHVPLKYPGLSPWQILVSESQERMTLSVPKENWQTIKDLADYYQVGIANVGEFNEDGHFTCYYGEELVCRLGLHFIHEGLPKLQLKATHKKTTITGWKKNTPSLTPFKSHRDTLKQLLSHPTIASKEKWVRQYDHEVQGATAVKPFEGTDRTAPNDAGVVWYGAHGMDGHDGLAVASGLCPHFSLDDTYLMGKMAVDEAVRNLICQGVDPSKIALVDNFCWPDPTPSPNNPDAEFKLAQLVRCCMGLKEIMQSYGMPLVSGKDSMKNDYHGESMKISVLPTLLVTALGHVPDVSHVPKSHAQSGDLLYRVGLRDYKEYFGHFMHKVVSDIPRKNDREFDFLRIRTIYQKMFHANNERLIQSAHDLSEGGMLVALFETLLLNNAGIDLDLTRFIGSEEDVKAYLYSELPGHFIVSIKKDGRRAFETLFAVDEIELLGECNSRGVIALGGEILGVDELAGHWRGEA